MEKMAWYEKNSNSKITSNVDKTVSITHDASAFYRLECLTEAAWRIIAPCCAYLTAEHIHGTVDVIISMEKKWRKKKLSAR